MKDREYDDNIDLHAEVHGVRKASEQRTTDSSPEILILERVIGNAVVRGAQLIEELQAKPGALALIPLVRRRDVELGSRLGNQPILGHRSGFAKRRSTSRAGRARLGSRR